MSDTLVEEKVGGGYHRKEVVNADYYLLQKFADTGWRVCTNTGLYISHEFSSADEARKWLGYLRSNVLIQEK